MRVTQPGTRHADLPDITANQHHNEDHWSRHAPAGADRGVGSQTFYVKSADEVVNNSATFQNDNHLSHNFAVAGTYIVDVYGRATIDDTAGLKVRWDFGAGGGSLEMVEWNQGDAFFPDDPGSIGENASSGVGISTDSGAKTGQFHYHGQLIIATPGTYAFQWAQTAAQALDTTVHQRTWAVITRIT